MTSQDGLALLKQMHQRGELTDEQYDTLRRHVLSGTPVPQLADGVPAPRPAIGPIDGYVPGAATVGPDRRPDPPGRHPGGPAGWYPLDPAEPPGPAPRRYASRRERREAEEASATPPPAAALPPAGSTAVMPPVGEPLPQWRDDVESSPGDGTRGLAPTRRHRQAPPEQVPPRRQRRDDVDGRPADGARSLAPTRRHREPPAEEVPARSARRPAEPEPDRRSRQGGATAAGPTKRRRPRRRSVVAVLTSVVLALALAAAGVYWFELRRQGLLPPAYAREACGTVRDWQEAVDSSNAKLIIQISRQQNKTTVRSDVTAYYTTIADRTDQLRVAILGLGPADITGGREYADSLAAAVGDQASGLRRLAGRAGRLNPAAATFPTDLQGILTGADTAVSGVTAALARPSAGISTELRTTLSNEPACAPYVG